MISRPWVPEEVGTPGNQQIDHIGFGADVEKEKINAEEDQGGPTGRKVKKEPQSSAPLMVMWIWKEIAQMTEGQ